MMKKEKKTIIVALILCGFMMISFNPKNLFLEYVNIEDELEKSQAGQPPQNAQRAPSDYVNSFLGGCERDGGYSIAIDDAGAIFVTGLTTSADFVTLNAFDGEYHGGYDAFVTKYNPDGTMNFSTYLGGTNGDYGKEIVADGNGGCIVTGDTTSLDFPTLNGFSDTLNGSNGNDIFITKFNPDGSLNYSTYFGGSSLDSVQNLKLGEDGALYITGRTYYGGIFGGEYPNPPFPTLNAFDPLCQEDEGFIVKFNADWSLNYSTFIGGKDDEYCYGMDIWDDGSCYISGYTYSSDLPTQNAFNSEISEGVDAFLIKVNPDGSLNFSTYLGGSNQDFSYDIGVDHEGSCIVIGNTNSRDFPVQNAYDLSLDIEYNFDYSDVFVSKFNNEGSLNFSTYLGGSGSDIPSGITVNEIGGFYITGQTSSINFPTKNNFFSMSNSMNEGFLSSFNSDGSLNYSTYYGGSGNDCGSDIEIDNEGICYMTGTTKSADLYSFDNSESIYSGGDDAFILTLPNPYDDPDADGLPNYWEYQMSLNITDPDDATVDSDSDGIINILEFQLGLNAQEIDSDGDGMDDGWEYQWGLDPANPEDATQDPDEDGLTNLQEYQQGSDPFTAQKPPAPKTIPSSKIYLTFSSGLAGSNPH